ncbi:hypothetical protein LUZ63_004705 [Rhynchospora breviuscula]|uniref:Uncharacterized protein n=1 Tax=Rhynchospora breviuscula TaxID=2022672 RepID=A0A9Q0HSE8_9POAL|nr:hypothetical protein LUZ63_004705 [Rhynchospora breviuscula]
MGKKLERLVFALNGERYEVSPVDPSLTLLEFIRTETRFRSSKLGCGEGGCGACAVLISRYNPITGEVSDASASSCLVLLCSINYCSVTTSEGLGNTKDGYHAIQQRFAGFHASQCGFCTPGMCMSLFASLVNADKDNSRPKPRDGFSKITVSEAEKAVTNNLCRCTGYRPIVDASKSFATDVDLEDLGLNIFWKSQSDASVEKLPRYCIGSVCTFPDFLKSEIKSLLNIKNNPQINISEEGWYHPESIEELYELLNSDVFNAGNVKLVVANTSSGVYKDQDLYDKYIDLRGIPELCVIKRSKEGIVIGSAVTITRVIELLKAEKNSSLVFNKLADHMNKVASQFVRNIASIGGNLILAQRNQFESDIATILLAAGSIVHIQESTKQLKLTLEEFLDRPPCDYKTILLNIFIPSWASSGNLCFTTFRAAPRPLGNAVSYVNAGFLALTTTDKKSGGTALDYTHLVFGAYGTDHAIRATKVEKYLKGKLLTPSVLLEAIRLLREIIKPKEATTHPSYRVSTAVGFLFNFLSTMATKSADRSLSSKQDIVIDKDYFPVGLPIKKIGAELQASGEAVFVDDIPSPKDCVCGAFIYSTKPLARIKKIDFKPSLASEKILAVICAKDIPKNGENIGCISQFGSEKLFADLLAEYAGQPLGVVVAETQRYANMAAKQVIVEYSSEDLQKPILTVEDAVENSSYFDVPFIVYPSQVGNFSIGMAEADYKILSAEVKLGSQYYFYMETQVALAIPDEDNCITVYSSSQFPEFTQTVIARCLGIPFYKVRIITRRTGGGFGGKSYRSIPLATACALAAYKLQRPVRMYMDRNTDMVMVGGRHPINVRYDVGFKSDGKITALNLRVLFNSGISKDYSPVMPRDFIENVKKYNWCNLSFDIKLCKTNLTSKSSMRAPGGVQGSFVAEAIIEHVASVLSLETNTVRRKNLHSYESLILFYDFVNEEAKNYTLPAIFDKLTATLDYKNRAETVRKFNCTNKWKKQGISSVPIVYMVHCYPVPGRVSIFNDASIAVEVGGIELGQGLWTKVKQMTAFCLEKLCENESLLERVHIIQTDTLSMPQGGQTGGSSTSESSCAAVQLACDILIGRLIPLKHSLQEENGAVSWVSLISKAVQHSINLSASSFFVPSLNNARYLNYGAATSEVEIDILTGETTILRSDLSYDCGQSLNPAVDLGQAEGCFVQGIGFFLYEECLTNSDGLLVTNSTWNYKIPTVDVIPKIFNVEIVNSGQHKNRILSSKASGEPPLLLAASVHCAVREAIRVARLDYISTQGGSEVSAVTFQMDTPATMQVVKELCGLDNVDKYLESQIRSGA